MTIERELRDMIDRGLDENNELLDTVCKAMWEIFMTRLKSRGSLHGDFPETHCRQFFEAGFRIAYTMQELNIDTLKDELRDQRHKE